MNSIDALPHDGAVLLLSLTLISVAFVFFVLLLGSLYRNVRVRRRGSRMGILALLCLQTADLAFLTGLNNVRFSSSDSRIPVSDVLHLPLWAHVLFFVFCVAVAVFELYGIRGIVRNSFSSDSVRQAVDNLPTGVCFADLAGDPLLTNRSMYSLVRELTGERLRNLNDFWALVENGSVAAETAAFARPGYPNELTFAMPDGRVFRLTRERLLIRGQRVLQVLATDVTPYYKLYGELTRDNAALAEQRAKLRELSESLEQMNHEEEVLRHKIRLHNEIGRTVLATRRYLSAENADPDNIKIYSVLWRELCDRSSFMNLGDPRDDARELREIFETARRIGCEIRMRGEAPAEEPYAHILRQILREAVVNAVRHADAAQVFVEIDRTADHLRFVVGNDGRPPAGQIREGGGLTALRRAVENAGGRMQIASESFFQLIVSFPL